MKSAINIVTALVILGLAFFGWVFVSAMLHELDYSYGDWMSWLIGAATLCIVVAILVKRW